jgi:hypothetical protein
MPWERKDGRNWSEAQKRAMWKIHTEEKKSAAEIAEQTGASSSGVSYILSGFRKRQETFKKVIVEPMQAHKAKEAAPKLLSDLQRVQDENAFLRWWNEGERRGYVERLLSEIQK